MHSRGLEPTIRATDQPVSPGDLGHQFLDHIHERRNYPDAAQMLDVTIPEVVDAGYGRGLDC